MKMWRSISAGMAALLVACVAQAQDYPSKPIKVVVPAVAGGMTDGFVRIIGDNYQKNWGQPVVMEHRGGAGGIIATQHVATAPADGYTLLMGNIGPLSLNQSLYSSIPYDAEKDLAPVALVATYQNILVVHPSLPVRTVKELIELAKAKPGTLTFSSAGVGQSHHLSGEMFKSQAGVDMVHVPYKGGAPAVTDLVGGHVDMMFSNIPLVIQHIRTGALRALAVTGPKRSAAFPDVPTMIESGLPEYNVISWLALVAPAKTPPEIVKRLNDEAIKALNSEEGRRHLETISADAGVGDPEYLAKFMADERAKWAKVIKAANIKLEQ